MAAASLLHGGGGTPTRCGCALIDADPVIRIGIPATARETQGSPPRADLAGGAGSAGTSTTIRATDLARAQGRACFARVGIGDAAPDIRGGVADFIGGARTARAVASVISTILLDAAGLATLTDPVVAGHSRGAVSTDSAASVASALFARAVRGAVTTQGAGVACIRTAIGVGDALVVAPADLVRSLLTAVSDTRAFSLRACGDA